MIYLTHIAASGSISEELVSGTLVFLSAALSNSMNALVTVLGVPPYF